MAYFFDTTQLKNKDRTYTTLVADIRSICNRYLNIQSTEQYNVFLRDLTNCLRMHKTSSTKSSLFQKEMQDINTAVPLSEKTVWGGVTLKKLDVAKDFVQKLLVIKKLGILGFEIHNLKHEKLKVLEGVVLVLYSNHAKKGFKKGKITLSIGTPGDKFEFLPKDEHGMIALTDAVVEETSTNHLSDLVYIYPSAQVI